ncbi:MAG: methyltransferase domain-containing protein [Ignavibacteriales bacterium]|jgi:Methylase involved in ubiquinone/menaquinone biosynthesis|nr:MAG: methyltransferase domain-containing protein [Ignavibacteriaceae bacterium]MBW7872664.1 methyltransferase domain-containing protein [Ignavibacteria bacterium]MCZ2143385.1 methyltransferase domain-containing protein [Ignavibacteriales bacterium]OQY74630.1 MAG: hypothetical protein B6D45_06595 [Ignavibacteriales bacterium UTCHB3]MBV6444265.1 hypothetical protein [Ignavibacteriaceae bacterium]
MPKDINSPQDNDNRNYDYTGIETENRKEYGVIANMITETGAVLDLGCGNGSLLQLLNDKGKCSRAVGIEISETGVEMSRKKGLEVIMGEIDERLPFGDNEFDYALCNVTIQMVMYPEVLLKEMKRVARKLIISFPNFGFYRNRLDMLLKGRMPQPMIFGYKWYNTGHIHQLSIADFKELLEQTGGLEIEKFSTVWNNNSVKDTLTGMFPNLFCLLPIFLLKKTN